VDQLDKGMHAFLLNAFSYAECTIRTFTTAPDGTATVVYDTGEQPPRQFTLTYTPPAN
jgi:hypothetical protein